MVGLSGLPPGLAGLAPVPGARGGGPGPVRRRRGSSRRLPRLQPLGPRSVGLPRRAARLPGGRRRGRRRRRAGTWWSSSTAPGARPWPAATPELLAEVAGGPADLPGLTAPPAVAWADAAPVRAPPAGGVPTTARPRAAMDRAHDRAELHGRGHGHHRALRRRRPPGAPQLPAPVGRARRADEAAASTPRSACAGRSARRSASRSTCWASRRSWSTPTRSGSTWSSGAASGTRPSSPDPCRRRSSRSRWFRPDELPELQFETSGALMALARASRNPQSPPLPSLGLLERHRREAG